MPKTKKTGKVSSAASLNAQVAKLMTTMSAALATAKALGLPVLTAEERVHTNGKLRAGETAAIGSVLATVDANPALFASLADDDDGTVDTASARAALSQAAALGPFVEVIAQLHTVVSDGMMASGAAVKTLSVPAYAIGKVMARTNAKVRTTMAPALTFYGTPARTRVAQATRATNKAKRAAKGAKSPSTGG